jgi:hypothetical protein
MTYKDLGVVLKQCKKAAIQLRVHELLHFGLQMAQALAYLATVSRLVSFASLEFL